MTISTQIITVLDDLCRRFGLAIDWSQENIMPYLQELAGKYINWEIATSKIWLVIAGVIIFIGVTMFACTVWLCWDEILGFLGCSIACVGLIVVVIQVYDIQTCIHFPEKQLVEYILGLMRRGI